MTTAAGRVLVRTTSASVKKHTGRDWDEWIHFFDKKGAKNFPYPELTGAVRKIKFNKKSINEFWVHLIAQGYETHHGKRVEGRNKKGLYSVSVTTALPISAKEIYQFWTSAEGTALWLKPLSPVQFRANESFEGEGGVYGEIRTLKVPLRIRLRWQEAEWDRPSTVQFYFPARPGKKSIVVIMHEGLANARLREQMRAEWREKLAAVKEAVTAAFETESKLPRKPPGKSPRRPNKQSR